MSKRFNTGNYKHSLEIKSVDELVSIILRKDDKEKEKNKQIAQLERKINEYKKHQKELEDELDTTNDTIRLRTERVNTLKNNYTSLLNKYDNCSLMSKFYKIIIILLVIVLILMIMIM